MDYIRLSPLFPGVPAPARFPLGYQGGGASRRILYGDPEAMEAAICFLEVRPYFFRSGYMYKDIL